MTTHSLTINIVADPNAGIIAPEDGYWLTIEQVLPDEKITAGEAARMIDALFDLSPCKDPIESGTEPAEEPPEDMAEALDKIAEKVEVDLTACERRLTGTYQTDLKIVRSHPDIPYTLRLSVGDILETVLVESQVAENLDVKAASSVTLTMPVQAGLRCTWQGTVIGKNGPIDPPTIKAAGNTLFWAGQATGTIRAEYASIHDVVTVEIPGIPNYVGTDRGEPQESTALAFYHYQVFPCDITPPPDDSEATLAEVCGWGGNTSWSASEDDEPLPEPPPPPEPVYGCIDYYPLAPFGSPVTEPWFYEQTCCVPGSFDGCRTRTSRIEGGKDLSEETRAQMTADWPGPIEFIGLGPITPAGCGTRYEKTKILQHNCCDEVEPMAWDTDTSAEVLAPGTSGIVGVTGGSGQYHWSVRGVDVWLDPAHTLRDGVTKTGYTMIYTGPNFCGFSPIEVADGCSIVNHGVRSTVGKWVLIASRHELTPCIISGDATNYIGDTSTGAPKFEKIFGKYRLFQISYANYYGTTTGPRCDQYPVDPLNPEHYSCITNFAQFIVSNAITISDHCFYQPLYGDVGRTWWVEHEKDTYEWT
ncbi:MAG: hypothetical protein WA151_24080, partial [Desulfatirhabdiaceae bacterium]